MPDPNLRRVSLEGRTKVTAPSILEMLAPLHKSLRSGSGAVHSEQSFINFCTVVRFSKELDNINNGIVIVVVIFIRPLAADGVHVNVIYDRSQIDGSTSHHGVERFCAVANFRE